MPKSGGMSRWARFGLGYAELKAPCSGRLPPSHKKDCHLLSKLFCECGPENKRCCDRILDRRLATSASIKEVKRLLTYNNTSSVLQVFLFKLVNYDNSGAYTLEDQANLTEEQREIWCAMGEVGVKLGEIFDDAIESLERAEHASVTKKFVNRSLKSGTPEGRSWKSLLSEAGIRDVLDANDIAALIRIIVEHCRTI